MAKLLNTEINGRLSVNTVQITAGNDITFHDNGDIFTYLVVKGRDCSRKNIC